MSVYNRSTIGEAACASSATVMYDRSQSADRKRVHFLLVERVYSLHEKNEIYNFEWWMVKLLGGAIRGRPSK